MDMIAQALSQVPQRCKRVVFFAVLAVLFLLRSAWAAPVAPKFEQVTTTSVSRPARRPHWIYQSQTGQIGLIWRYPPVDRAQPGVTYVAPTRTYATEFGYAEKTAQGFNPSQEKFEIPVGERGIADFEVLPSTGNLLVSQRFHGSAVRSGTDICVRELSIKADNKISVAENKLSILPYDAVNPDFKKRLDSYINEMKSLAAKTGNSIWFMNQQTTLSGAAPRTGDLLIDRERVYSAEDFSCFSGISYKQSGLWLTGIDRILGNTDTPQNYLWVIESKNGGKSWEKRQVIARGNFPTLAPTKNNDLLLFFTDVTQFGWQGQWPDDAGREVFPDGYHWPGRGKLMLMRSSDAGKTWSKPQLVIDDKQIIQSRVYLAKDGRLWLVYVQSHPAPSSNKRASLWLTSSTDDGKTWRAPQQITDGKTLDREPDIIEHDNKLLIAFSRAGMGINTNIWVAEIDTQRF